MTQLAGDLGLNRNTVARAYKMLEERGVIQSAGMLNDALTAETGKD